jgi:hypothetical protein
MMRRGDADGLLFDAWAYRRDCLFLAIMANQLALEI